MTSELYGKDYYAWTAVMAETIRHGDEVSREDQFLLAEEIEDLGKAELSKLESAVEQLYLHLLKQRHQPAKAGSSWETSIKKQRFQIERLLKRNPSFKRYLRADESDAAMEFLADAYKAAVFEAMEQTGLPAQTFDAENPFGYDAFGLPPLTNKSGGR
jgi:hypothetical protein